jgi:hypothetical protein
VKRNNLKEFTAGWLVGDFLPAMHNTSEIEVAVKYFMQGDTEPAHYQKVATEITVIVGGKIEMNGEVYVAGEIVTIEPLETAVFKCLENSQLVCIKFPSLPSDKVLA